MCDEIAKGADTCLELRQPIPDVQERLLVGDVEDEDETHCIAEERRCKTAKPKNVVVSGMLIL